LTLTVREALTIEENGWPSWQLERGCWNRPDVPQELRDDRAPDYWTIFNEADREFQRQRKEWLALFDPTDLEHLDELGVEARERAHEVLARHRRIARAIVATAE
jgi:hypothetical protein